MNIVLFDIDDTLTRSQSIDDEIYLRSLSEVFGFVDVCRDWAMRSAAIHHEAIPCAAADDAMARVSIMQIAIDRVLACRVARNRCSRRCAAFSAERPCTGMCRDPFLSRYVGNAACRW